MTDLPARCPRVVGRDGGALKRCGNEQPCPEHHRLDGIPTEELEAEVARRNQDHDD